MQNLPLFFNVKKCPVLIVGGGRIATRRALSCLRAGAVINLISPQIVADARGYVQQSGGTLTERIWHPSDITSQYKIVIAATDSASINAKIKSVSRKLGIPVHISTDPSDSDFLFPSVIDRDPITIAVSSGSASPILASLLAQRIDSLIPTAYGKLGNLIRKFRHQVRSRFDRSEDRKLFWKRVLEGSVAETFFSGNANKAEQMLQEQLEDAATTPNVGEAYLIGAGPGDPDLLTFRAFRLLQQSDLILYDRLVSPRILDQVSDKTEMVYVGKQRANHSVPQTEINQQLVNAALQGKRVARLKGGDPFIFGRGGEEIELLAQHHIPFQVVPGITAASGCASYSGIPLTHRDHAQSVRFVTGQLKDGTVDLPWKDLISSDQTLVIYMGLNGLPIIAQQLTDHGMDPDIPVAMIEQGTTPEQKVHCATLSELPEMVKGLNITPPTLVIVGTVVSLHQSLNWFQPQS